LVANYKPKSTVAAALTVTDIAGLVKGASEGNGLGNEVRINVIVLGGFTFLFFYPLFVSVGSKLSDFQRFTADVPNRV
jgi:hypothetical protein